MESEHKETTAVICERGKTAFPSQKVIDRTVWWNYYYKNLRQKKTKTLEVHETSNEVPALKIEVMNIGRRAN